MLNLSLEGGVRAMAEHVQPSTRGFYLPFVSRNAVARFCPDLVSEILPFKEQFWEQFIAKGKPGRAFDGVVPGSISKFQAAASALLAGRQVSKHLQLLGSDDLPADFKACMDPTFYGITAGWETTASEPSYCGSIRLGITGTRQVAVGDFSRILEATRGAKGMSSGGMTLAAVRQWFRNMTQDCKYVRTYVCMYVCVCVDASTHTNTHACMHDR